MPLIPYPDVPSVDGVPSLPRLPGYIGSVVTAAIGAVEGALWQSITTDKRWGIYDANGNALADPSDLSGVTQSTLNSLGLSSTMSTVSVEYTNQSRLSDFPVEKGSFAQYNKVQTPGEVSVTLAFSGTEQDRASFLTAIDKASKSVDLYSVVTPEVTYLNQNIEGYSYSRTAEHGTTLLIVQLNLKEIRQVSAQYSNSSTGAVSPSVSDASATVSSGKVQATNPVKSALNAVANTISNLAATAITQAQSL